MKSKIRFGNITLLYSPYGWRATINNLSHQDVADWLKEQNTKIPPSDWRTEKIREIETGIYSFIHVCDIPEGGAKLVLRWNDLDNEVVELVGYTASGGDVLAALGEAHITGLLHPMREIPD